MPRRLLRPTLTALALALGPGCGGGALEGAGDPRPASPPQRIVAASILATEVLLEIAPRDRLVAVHALAADPTFSLVADEVKGLTLVGAEPEQLLAVRPDLVITDAYTRAETRVLLASAGVPVLCTAAPTDFAQIAENVRRIGRACHLDGPAEALVTRMQERLAAVRARGADLGAFGLCSLDGGLHTYGRGSLFDAMVAAVGARNLAAEHGAGAFRKLSQEALLAWRPDVLVVDGDAGAAGAPSWLQQVPGLHLLPCVRKERLLFVPGRLLGTTSHHLVDTAELVQARLLLWGRP